MDKFRLEEMKGGWFIGDFTPTLFRTQAVEVAVKEYSAGASEEAHYHRIATEFTVVVRGEVEMGGMRLRAGDIAVIRPGESTGFHAVTDAVTAVVKIPGAQNDKYKGSGA